ncbi:unnamed protein product [Heterobilharzia americana]|nr:unnamed protein product [Heterobilharzia americana]
MFHGKKFLQPGTASTTNATTRAIGRPCLAGTQTQQQDHTLPTAGSSSSSAIHGERNSQLARLRQLQQLYQRLAVLSAIKSEKVEGKNDKNDATSYRFNFTSNYLPTFHGEKVLQLGRAFPASTSNASFLADIEKAAMMYRNAAEMLANIMNDLFGNVVFAALDTDKYKYPIGSGSVAFSSQESYMKAIAANFVDIRTPKFVKTIQIDPYLQHSLCDHCYGNPGIYFCRAFECFSYFCPRCWQLMHNRKEMLKSHKPVRRTFKSNNDHILSTTMTLSRC